MLCARQGMLTLPAHLIPLLFCKGVRGFQTFVLFVYVLPLSLFQICLVSLDYTLLISHMGILHCNPTIKVNVLINVRKDKLNAMSNVLIHNLGSYLYKYLYQKRSLNVLAKTQKLYLLWITLFNERMRSIDHFF